MSPEFKFGRGKARQAFALGDLERSVLDALWDRGEMSGKEVFERLGAKHKVAHNTLLTVLDRLIAKGLVMKKREGKNNLYSAKLTRDEFASKIASPIIEALLDVSSNAAISAFIKTAQRDPAKLDELKKLIMEAEKKASDKSKEKKKK